MKDKILVIGSSNIDLLFKTARFHLPGETIKGEHPGPVFGGKGANQAFASRRLGGKTLFLTKMGCDPYGESYDRYLVGKGFNQKYLLKDKTLPTGLALIQLAPNGENRIIVSPGANASLTVKELTRLTPVWKNIKVFVTQFEIPVQTVIAGLRTAKKHGAITLLNPSPPVRLPTESLSLIDYIVPNEWEAQALTGIEWKENRDIRRMAIKLLEMGIKNILITLGAKGLFFKNRTEEIRMKGFRVKTRDTTAAGDAFLGAFACGLSEDKGLRETLRFASGAGALATTKLGAQPSLPSRKELQLFLKTSR